MEGNNSVQGSDTVLTGHVSSRASKVEPLSTAKPFINKPLDNYEGLKIICGDDQATGSYAKSIFENFGQRVDLEDTFPVNNVDEQTQVEDNVDRPNGLLMSCWMRYLTICRTMKSKVIHGEKGLEESMD